MVMMCREDGSYIASPIIELILFLRILLLKMFTVFADVKSGGNFHHNLGPRVSI